MREIKNPRTTAGLWVRERTRGQLNHKRAYSCAGRVYSAFFIVIRDEVKFVERRIQSTGFGITADIATSGTAYAIL